MTASWRLLETGAESGAWNMAVDEVLLEGMVRDRGLPVIRFYGWRPPAVSFGYGQDPGREVDPARCAEAGVEVVRRITGGRAVLHWEELTYSVVCTESDPILGGRVEDTYRRIGESLVEGLRRFGVDAVLERASLRPPRHRTGEVTSPCFSSIARSEIKVRGRKLIGSAQRRLKGAVLQHGSVLTGPAHRRLLDLLPPMPATVLESWRAQLQEGSVDLAECLGEEVDLHRLSRSLAAGFEQALGVDLVPGALGPEEEARAAVLASERYGEPRWSVGRGDEPAAAVTGPLPGTG